MDKKLKECTSPHALMHTLFGIGLGLLLVNFVPGLPLMTLGLGAVVVAFVLEMMRK